MNTEILADAYFRRIVSAILVDKQDEARMIRQEMGRYFPQHPKYKAFGELEHTSHAANAIQRKVYFLGVGINDYKPPLRRLRGCVNDVNLIEHTLLDIWGAQLYPKTLLDNGATSFSVKTILEELIAVTAPDDVLVFYFSGCAGHGLTDVPANSDYYLAVSDSEVEKGIWSNVILGGDLQKYMSQSKAHNKFVIIDSDSNEAFIKSVEKGGDYSAIFGCSPGEGAMELNGNGVFTHYLCEAVRNQQALRAKDFFLYKKVCEEIGLKHKQTPFMVGDVAPLFFDETRIAFHDLVKIVFSERNLSEQEFYTVQSIFQQSSSWFWPILKKMGNYLLEKQQWEKAAYFLEEYLRFERDLETSLQLVEIYDLLGNDQHAQRCIQQWIELQQGLAEEHPARILLNKYETLDEASKERYALLVGISKYDILPSLLSSRKDAEHWYEYLTKDLNIPAENVTLLTDEYATKESLLEALQKHCAISAKHPVLFFFSGYGSAYDAEALETSLRYKDAGLVDLPFTGIDEHAVIPAILSVDARKDGIADILFTDIQDIYQKNNGKHLSCIFDIGGDDSEGARGLKSIKTDNLVRGGLDLDELDLNKPENVLVPKQQCGAVTLLPGVLQTSRTKNRKSKLYCEETKEGGVFTTETLKILREQMDAPFDFLQKRLCQVAYPRLRQTLSPILLGHTTMRLLHYHRFAEQEIQAFKQGIWENLKRALYKIAGSRSEEDFPDCQVNIAIAEALLNNIDKALSILTFTATEKDKEENNRNVLANYHLGRLLVLTSPPNDKEKWSQAASSLRIAAKKSSDMLPIYYYLGKAIRQVTLIEGRNEAAAAFQKYEEGGYPIGFKNEVMDYLDSLDEKRLIKRKMEEGQQYINEKNYAEAERSFEDAKIAGSLDADYQLGRVYEAQQDALQALNAYIQARENNVSQVDLPKKIAEQYKILCAKSEFYNKILNDLEKYTKEQTNTHDEANLKKLIESIQNMKPVIKSNTSI